MTANYTRARRRHALAMLRGTGVMKQISPNAQLIYAVGLLICNDAGVLKQEDLTAAMNDDSIVQAARELLRKAAA